MKAYMLFSSGGPLVILTSHESITDTELLRKLEDKGISKFLAHELDLDLTRERYGMHFRMVVNDLHETDDLRVLDYDGQHAFNLFHLDELGAPTAYEASQPSV